jgi:hypothetical protein
MLAAHCPKPRCCPAHTHTHAGKLEQEVGCEDPWNGELLVRMIDMPFVDADKDAAEVSSWRI